MCGPHYPASAPIVYEFDMRMRISAIHYDSLVLFTSPSDRLARPQPLNRTQHLPDLAMSHSLPFRRDLNNRCKVKKTKQQHCERTGLEYLLFRMRTEPRSEWTLKVRWGRRPRTVPKGPVSVSTTGERPHGILAGVEKGLCSVGRSSFIPNSCHVRCFSLCQD